MGIYLIYIGTTEPWQ